MNNMTFKRKLPIPKVIKEKYPITPDMQRKKTERSKQITDIFTGQDPRLLLIIGPCSADNSDAVLDYVGRLRKIEDEVKDKIFIIPRIYTNKPRSNGMGYMGMLHNPDPESNSDILAGIIAVRSLYQSILKDYGFICADEMLYPENHRYLSDLLGYVAVGARSSENQQHRLVASGLSIPVGMKNPTSGNLEAMINSLRASQSGHTFLYRGWEVESAGNPLAHGILRGYVGRDGEYVSNYHYDDLKNVLDLIEKTNAPEIIEMIQDSDSHHTHNLKHSLEYKQKFKLKNPSLIVDCNHANSGKNYKEQINIAHDVMNSRRTSYDIQKLVKGLMIESYIEDGAQDVGSHIYGKSITDPCLGWEKTSKLIYELAESLK